MYVQRNINAFSMQCMREEILMCFQCNVCAKKYIQRNVDDFSMQYMFKEILMTFQCNICLQKY